MSLQVIDFPKTISATFDVSLLTINGYFNICIIQLEKEKKVIKCSIILKSK